MNVFEAIRKDHDIQRELCRLVSSTSGKSKDRKQKWKELKHELQNSRRCRRTHILRTVNS